MAIIGNFFKARTTGDKADDPAELAAEISRLMAEKSSAEAEMAAIAARRPQLLLEDRDADLDADERKAEKFYRVVEKVDARLPDLRARLAAAKNGERDKRLGALRKAERTAHLAYRDALGVACERVAALMHVLDRKRAEGAPEDSITVPRMVSRELLAQYATDIARYDEAARPIPAPVPRPVAPAPAPAAPTPIKPKAAAAPPPPPPKPPFVPPTPDENGFVRVTILRPGMEFAGARPIAGETIALPSEEAMRVVRSGHAEFEGALR